MTDFNSELDARGLNCPLPILRTKKSMSSMAAGEILKVVATDPGSIKDMEAYAKQTGHDIIDRTESDGEFTFYIKKN
ncbi:MAG: preprotein translocase subunit TatC [Proteobacteria bacterium]|nr:MAG: preprotein translocase subunit TatC [Pseudomonadota bacterium]